MSPRVKLAIVGGGPSAFYVASRLLQLLPATSSLGENLRIHIYDRLWAPHGLVRFGVAPDHPEVKVRHAAFLHAKYVRTDTFFSSCPKRIVLINSMKLQETSVSLSSGT